MNGKDNMVLDSLGQSFSYFQSKIVWSNSEELWVAALNSHCRIISSALLFKGTINYCFFHPRDILRFAIVHNSVSIIIAHNHPSNNCLPSQSDYENTKDLYLLCQLLQIPLLDHLIITEKDCYSFKQNKVFDSWELELGLVKK